ncbi:MAG: hypothetical protein IID18_06175 [Nitrospinae bacterium]|nr:hypothetical protein [Nitrospinota bacterium]
MTGQSFDNFKFPAPENEPGATEIETEAIVVQIDDILPNALLNFRMGKDHVDNLFFSRPRRMTLASYTTMFQPITGASLHANVVGLEFNGVFQESGIWYQVGVRNKSPRYDSNNHFENRLAAWYAVLNIPFLEDQTFGFMFSSDEIGNENDGIGTPGAIQGGEGRTYGVGGVLDLHWGNFNLVPAFYYYNEDGDIHFRSGAKLDKTDLEVLSGTVELHYPLMNELIGTLRWDWLDVIGQRSGVYEDDIDQYVASLAWYFHPNFRVVAEYSYMLAQLNRLTTFPFNNDLFVSVPGALNSGVINNNNRAFFKDTRLSMAIEFDF